MELVGPLVGREHGIGRLDAVYRAADKKAGRRNSTRLVAVDLLPHELRVAHGQLDVVGVLGRRHLHR